MTAKPVSEQMQEYLETIYRLEEEGKAARTGEIAGHLKVAPPSVTDMIQKLEKAGLVEYEPYKGVTLTESGRTVGRRQLEKHRIMQAFLQEACGMDHQKAHEAACDMEHTLPAELEAFCAKYLEERLGKAFDTGRKVKEQIPSR
ncbi:MAG: DtxR family transcriptional regulator, Mn-dependent transcriptional regulator [Thermoplasmata archaeon]|jgi:DtxR family Mn-dependent transcriptional regulator|nr:DtxR family transcriptional regulator, Mn-dependent transcriptional regulator [Thermoplasmata archaeon]